MTDPGLKTAPLSPGELFELFDELGIAHSTVEHPPLYTVKESRHLRGELPGAHVKNLFLYNKKKKMWLLTCLEDRVIDLKALRRRLDTTSLSFCSPDRLMQYLGVTPGAVTPFGVVNDKSGEVQMVLDKALYTLEPLNFHPLDNRKTTAVSAAGLTRFLEYTNHFPMVLDFDDME